jgi:putative sigma-54 modulation protein
MTESWRMLDAGGRKLEAEAMRLDITGRHVEITPPLRQLIEDRLGRLERLLNDSLLSVKVILTLEKYRHRAEIIVHARGDHTLRGRGEGNAWRISIRQAMEKLEQQAERVKTKWAERKRSDTRRRVPRAAPGDGAGARAAAAAERADAERAPRVIRATRYAVKPMSVEDAAFRLEGTPETFVVFRHADTDAVSILYRRKDGNLGLIEPD